VPEPARPLGTDDADDLRLYLEAAAREPLLTKEEEVELAMTIEGGKDGEDRLRAGRLRSEKSIAKARADVKKAEAARQRFIMANLRLWCPWPGSTRARACRCWISFRRGTSG